MSASLDTPKVFVSYSWKPIKDKQRALDLANRLSGDGVHVIIDEWDLAEGQDKFQFMEQMVNNPEIKRVLLICNKEYSQKANDKKGGVGIESTIISPEIYTKADQTKFVPIIFERDEEGVEFLPTFIKSRIYIDLSSDDIFEDQYEKLLRNIFEKPTSRRPPIGTRPAYLLNEEPTFLPTSNKVKAIKNALLNDKRNHQIFINDYYLSFIEGLKGFEILEDELSHPDKIDEAVLERIEAMKSLRNDFVDFLEVVLTYSVEFNLDAFISFLEKLVVFIASNKANSFSSNYIGSMIFDQFRFFFYELFLYITAVLIDKERYTELGSILSNDFIVFNEDHNKTCQYDFTIFQNPVSSLDDFHNKKLKLNRLSVVGDHIKQRVDNPKYSFDKLKEYDCLLYYISIMLSRDKNSCSYYSWFPSTSVYRTYTLPFLKKLVSEKYFNKVKRVFDVNTKEDLELKVNKAVEEDNAIRRMFYHVPYITHAFDLDTIGTFK